MNLVRQLKHILIMIKKRNTQRDGTIALINTQWKNTTNVKHIKIIFS